MFICALHTGGDPVCLYEKPRSETKWRWYLTTWNENALLIVPHASCHIVPYCSIFQSPYCTFAFPLCSCFGINLFFCMFLCFLMCVYLLKVQLGRCWVSSPGRYWHYLVTDSTINYLTRCGFDFFFFYINNMDSLYFTLHCAVCWIAFVGNTSFSPL